MKALNVVVAGVGGQGSILASHTLAEALMRSGGAERVRVGETFGAAQRGGAVASHVRAGSVHGPLVPPDGADAILALEPLEGLRVARTYLAPTGIVALNTRPVPPVDVKAGYVVYPPLDQILAALGKLGRKVYALDGERLAAEAGDPRTLSTVMLGVLWGTGVVPVKREAMHDAITHRVPPRTIAVNLRAFDLGAAAAEGAVSQ